MRRRALIALFVVLPGVASSACSFLIGLDDRPARPVDASSESLTDAGSEIDGGTYCSHASGALLCDDFDQPGQTLSTQWPGVPLLQFKSPTTVRDASMAIIDDEYATSLPRALDTALSDSERGGLTAALVARQFPTEVGQKGVVYSFDFQLLSFTGDRDGSSFSDTGPNPTLLNEPRVGLGGFLSLTPDLRRYAVAVTANGSHLGLSESIEGDEVTNYALVASVSLLKLGDRAWLRMTIASGARDRVVAYAKSAGARTLDCPDTPFVTAAWPSLPPDQAGCVASDPRYAFGGGLSPFAVVLGISASDRTVAHLRYDTVRLDPLP